ncbi:hypothetical protein UMZ34_11175 [Halopseudomonas pachastrellae]|nr:hypothetical protein UMZ34_11175 [Halopseudomonas pachastrellae]
MDGGIGLMAAAAGGQSGGLRNQVDQQVIAVRPDRSDRKALPKGQKRINIVHKNAGLWMCLFALTSSIKPAFLFLSFPGFREEPKKGGTGSISNFVFGLNMRYED